MDNRFDLFDLPEGHEARFEARCDRRLKRQRRRQLAFRWSAAAAALALVVALNFAGSRSSLLRARTPEAIYTAYLKEVGDLYKLMATNSRDDAIDWEGVLSELTEENVPLYEQLPEEMSRREKTSVLRRYYGGILREAGQLKEINKKQ